MLRPTNHKVHDVDSPRDPSDVSPAPLRFHSHHDASGGAAPHSAALVEPPPPGLEHEPRNERKQQYGNPEDRGAQGFGKADANGDRVDANARCLVDQNLGDLVQAHPLAEEPEQRGHDTPEENCVNAAALGTKQLQLLPGF